MASALHPLPSGRSRGPRLDATIESAIDEAVHEWLPAQRQLARPATDSVLEIKRRCALSGLVSPSRSTVSRRWATYREQEALAPAALPDAIIAPGTFEARYPLDIVQIDHTQADILLVNELDGQVIGRPWLSLALDVATRCVLGFYLGMERPGAATVGLLLTRVVLPKAPWLEKIGVEADWPMRGNPRILHLDNAAEFKSRALHLNAPFGHHFFEVAQAQRVRDIPAHAQNDDIKRIMKPLEHLASPAGSVLRGESFVLGILFVTGDRMQILTHRLSATKPLSLTLRAAQLTRLRRRHREHNGRNSSMATALASPTSI